MLQPSFFFSRLWKKERDTPKTVHVACMFAVGVFFHKVSQLLSSVCLNTGGILSVLPLRFTRDRRQDGFDNSGHSVFWEDSLDICSSLASCSISIPLSSFKHLLPGSCQLLQAPPLQLMGFHGHGHSAKDQVSPRVPLLFPNPTHQLVSRMYPESLQFFSSPPPPLPTCLTHFSG